MNEAEKIIKDMEKAMNETINAAKEEIAKIRAGRVSPALIENIIVNVYDTKMRIKEIGDLSVKDARTIAVKPWDPSILPNLHKELLQANIGANISIDNNVLLVIYPPLTEETRKQMQKKVKEKGETFKISIRNERRDALEKIRNLKKNKLLSEDDCRSYENKIQKITDNYLSQIDKLVEVKSKEIMEI